MIDQLSASLPAKRAACERGFYKLACALAAGSLVVGAGSGGAAVRGLPRAGERLEASLIDSDEKEFFISHAMDLEGRLFVGGREALFVYEPAEGGGFGERQEIYRFPKDTWLYDVEVYGGDLFVATNTAVYRLPDAVTKRAGITPKKLLWGAPQGHFHQGLHALELGPNGDLYISMGDPQPHVHVDHRRPDHLWHWTFYVGPENKPFSYTGNGAVLRYSLRDQKLTVHGGGLRNCSGISFDSQWNLFANDNDEEGSVFSPGRLLFVPDNAWNGWARGWSARAEPKRLDQLPVLDLQLDVPVGQCYYDDAVLGAEYRGSVFVANWGSRTVSRHRIAPSGAGFRGPAKGFLTGDGIARPVSATVANDGRMIVSVCYMQGNEGSPVRKTDLLLISPRGGGKPNNVVRGDLVDLLARPWQIRYRAHQEILRVGGAPLEKAARRFLDAEPGDPAFASLIFLAGRSQNAACAARIRQLAADRGEAAVLAMRVLAENGGTADVDALLEANSDPAFALASVNYCRRRPGQAISDAVARLAAHEDAFVRQATARLLAERGDLAQVDKLLTGDKSARLAGTMAAGFAIWDGAEKETVFPPGGLVANPGYLKFTHPDGAVNLKSLGKPIGIFSLAEWWREKPNRVAHEPSFLQLQRSLDDADARVRTAAAVFLFFLRDERVDGRVVAVLAEQEIVLAGKDKAGTLTAAQRKRALRALKFAKLSTRTELAPAFAKLDLSKAHRDGDAKRGEALYTERGCAVCHISPGGKGGSIGPTLLGVGGRFSAEHIAESVLLPNAAVSPNFYPNVITLKDGTVQVGFVESQREGEIELRVVTGQLLTLTVSDIKSREVGKQSLMPGGMIQTPAELRDLLAYLIGSRELGGDR